MSDHDVRLIPLGVGEAFTARHFTTCLALGVGDEWLLIECPHPIRRLLNDASRSSGVAIDLDRVVGVILSHLHADHCSGLEDYGYYCYFALGRRAPLAIHPVVAAPLWDGLLRTGMGSMRLRPDVPPVERALEDYFDIVSLDIERPVHLGPFAIECRPTVHSIPTTAFRIQVAERTLGFSGDTAFDPSLIDWLAAADLVVHEVTDHEHSVVHTPYSRLAELPAELRARFRLIHYPDHFDIAASAIEALEQGRCYTL